MTKEEWVDWATIHWNPIIHYIPTISLLTNKWLVFVFIEEMDALHILAPLWTIQKGSLVLSRWHSRFDPLKERITKRHLWVILPSLPFPLWNKYFLVGFSNSIGHFFGMVKDFNLAFDKRMARVLVEIDVSKGMLAKTDIVCGGFIINQRLDYLHLPFHCNFCHNTCNLRRNCLHLLHGNSVSQCFD